MACLYISIIGFVITVADTVLFFYKFTQKDKVLWFHLVYFLMFFITGLVAIAPKDYTSGLKDLNGIVPGSPVCLVNGFVD
jgi:hypothetical protein